MEEGPQFWSWDLDNGGWASIQLGWVQRKERGTRSMWLATMPFGDGQH